MPAKSPSFLELAHLVISLLCGNKPVSYSYKLVYQSTLLVGTMGDSRLGNQLTDDSHREKHQILINHKLKRKKQYVNPEKPDVPLNKNDAFQKVQKRRVQEKR